MSWGLHLWNISKSSLFTFCVELTVKGTWTSIKNQLQTWMFFLFCFVFQHCHQSPIHCKLPQTYVNKFCKKWKQWSYKIHQHSTQGFGDHRKYQNIDVRNVKGHSTCLGADFFFKCETNISSVTSVWAKRGTNFIRVPTQQTRYI